MDNNEQQETAKKQFKLSYEQYKKMTGNGVRYMELLDTLTLAELVKTVKSRAPPSQRIGSNYRGVSHSSKEQKWEAKVPCATGKKGNQVSLGFFEEEAEAAKAFDRAMVRQHGTAATINFDHSDYQEEMLVFHKNQIKKLDGQQQEGKPS